MIACKNRLKGAALKMLEFGSKACKLRHVNQEGKCARDFIVDVPLMQEVVEEMDHMLMNVQT